MLPAGCRDGEAITNGVRLHYVTAGAPLVLLLHGFPECWYSWRHQIGPLASAGYHVVAPDLRGYGRSEKPPGVAAYAIDRLVGDIAGLAEQLAPDGRAHAVVGHDWGGGITWATGQLRPDVTARLVVVNCPPAQAMARAWRIPRQLARSWYIGFFQAPWLPELLLRAGGFRFVDATLAPARRRNAAAVTPADIAYTRKEMARPGALTGGINYYRALWRRRATAQQLFHTPNGVPARLIWGDADPYLDVRLTEDIQRWAPRCDLRRLPGAGHFCHQEQPDLVTQLLLEHLAA